MEEMPGERPYSAEQARSIAEEFSRSKDLYYLDHAGATLYSEIQIANVFRDFSSNMYGNPHARNTSSQSTQDSLDIVRYQILSHFHTTHDDYSVVFTSGTTQALKMVAETFNFNGGTLMHLEDNHTSVLGMRNYAKNCSVEIKVAEAHQVLSVRSDKRYDVESYEGNGLFVYPAESNFSGVKYPLQWIESVEQGNLNDLVNKHLKWYTLLDAACFVSTNDLDLDKYKPDFITVSFYKVFGYPTGLGALLVKKHSEKALQKKYFGGGTVLMALSSENVMIPRPNLEERFEDGTLPFLSILAVKHGLDTLKKLCLNMELISKHTFNLAKYVYDGLASMKYSNGVPVAVLYHADNFQDRRTQGGIVNFNLLRSDGKYVGYAEVLHMANLHGIQLRTGCFCNPGACQLFLRLSPEDVRRHFEAGHVCGDQHDLVDGLPTGSVRVSFGYMSTYEEARRLLEMVQACFVTESSVLVNNEVNKIPAVIDNDDQTISGELAAIFLYPVKSCGAYAPTTSWELTNTGLRYDRKWMVVSAAGACVSQKQIKSLCLVKPVIDLKNNVLVLSYKGAKNISLPLESLENTIKENTFCDSKICGDQIQGYDCGNEVADWLSENLQKPGLRLLRQCETSGRTSNKGGKLVLSLANQAQYLLVNKATIRWLKDKLPNESNLSLLSLVSRFRPNFLVEFDKPFVENILDEISFGSVPFKFSGVCTRCQMICVDQDTGTISSEPLQTLSKQLKGKTRFGIYLSHTDLTKTNIVSIKCSVSGHL